MRRALLRTLIVTTAVLATVPLPACSNDRSPPPPAASASAPLFGAGYPTFRDERTGIRAVLGTPDLAVGAQRVSFVMSDQTGLIQLPVLRVESFFYADGAGGQRSGPLEAGSARFFAFPYETRGLYALRLRFDRAGTWGIDVHLPKPDGSVATTTLTFPVAPRARSLAVGDPAPPSRNRTLADVRSAAQLTTGSDPDTSLYQKSVARSLAAHRPLVVVFASPAFCTNELCGPQVEVLGDLQKSYGDRVDFIHIDLYSNPDEIKGDLARAVRNPLLKEWGVTSDEWTFVVGADGKVAERFESFVTRDELEPALRGVLTPTAARVGN